LIFFDKVMKLLFDLTPTQWKANGSGIYTTMVFSQALKKGYKFDCIYSTINELPNFIKKTAEDNDCKLWKYENKTDFEKIVAENSFERIYFGTTSNTDCLVPDAVEMIVTLHDLRFIEVPSDRYRYLYRETKFGRIKQRVAHIFFPFLSAKQQIKSVSKFIYRSKLKIVTVSNHSKYSILQFFPSVPKEKIQVMYCPYPEIRKSVLSQESFDILHQYQVTKKDFVLIISANRWFKNSFRALLACDELISDKQFQNKKVIVVGRPTKAVTRKIKNKLQFIFIDYVSDEILQFLYKNAFCFLYPSLQEGFGIPPIEAMIQGTPVLASAISSVPEICGDGALYFNPYSVSEIKNRLLQILNDVHLRNNLIEKSQNRLDQLHTKQEKDIDSLISLICK
jgi:glycosyltransferase involved in cell wall biosynthesis